MAPRVAVIGAGAVGLSAIKNFKDEGFDVTGFEARDYVGGLWKDSEDSTISVHSTTIFNSSKFRSAFSDFPLPNDTDDFPTAVQLHNYLESYCDHFDMRKHIHLGTAMTGLKREGERWGVEVKPKDGPARTEYFDKVAIASGYFYKPKVPELNGIENFQGRVMHSIEYHGSAPFKDQKVLLVGLHASAQDISNSLAETATKVYASHRSGVVLIPNYGSDGSTFDQNGSLNFMLYLCMAMKYSPSLAYFAFDKILLSMSRKAFPDLDPKWNLLPAPSTAVSPPLVADRLSGHLKSGFVEPVHPIAKITGPKSVEFTDGTSVHDIDTILYCTGYDLAYPFIPAEFNPLPVIGELPNLYRNVFPLHPDPKIRESLAFVGASAIPFPGFVQWDVLSMCIAQIFAGKSSLPPLTEMKAWHERTVAWRKQTGRKYHAQSTFHTAFMRLDEQMEWYDETAGLGLYAHFGWFRWRGWKLWWQDRELYKMVSSGLFSPAIWRLFDMGKRKPWPGAKEQIAIDNEMAKTQREARLESIKQAEKSKKSV